MRRATCEKCGRLFHVYIQKLPKTCDVCLGTCTEAAWDRLVKFGTSIGKHRCPDCGDVFTGDGCQACTDRAKRKAEQHRKYQADWYKKPGSKEKVRKRNQAWRQRPGNKEKSNANTRKWRANPKVKEKISEYNVKYARNKSIQQQLEHLSLAGVLRGTKGV